MIRGPLLFVVSFFSTRGSRVKSRSGNDLRQFEIWKVEVDLIVGLGDRVGCCLEISSWRWGLHSDVSSFPSQTNFDWWYFWPLDCCNFMNVLENLHRLPIFGNITREKKSAYVVVKKKSSTLQRMQFASGISFIFIEEFYHVADRPIRCFNSPSWLLSTLP